MEKVIAIDGDGVMFDYGHAYALAWARTFGSFPKLKNKNAYWPTDKWEVSHLHENLLHIFRKQFDGSFWSSMPPLTGAVEACNMLVADGYRLVCVTAMEPEFESNRLSNLKKHGFPIDQVIATGDSSRGGDRSPKADVLNELKPVAFVDDFIHYFVGVDPAIHRALITREPDGSPNHGEVMKFSDTSHINLLEFARWWIAK
jgi:phosphoglycolate phosphatase-like HAD superfamily hydrolase